MNTTMNNLATIYVEGVADAFFKAYKGMRCVVVDVKEINKRMAYEIQDAVVRKLCHDLNTHITGYRVAMTNKAIKATYYAHNPIYGTLTHMNMSDGIVSYDNLLEPYILTGLIFTVNDDISPTADEEEILSKTTIAPGIEIVDSRIKNWFRNLSLVEIIADNSVASQVIIGTSQKIKSIEELKNIEVSLWCGDEVLTTGKSEEVMENPLNAVMWLVAELAGQGKSLKKGMVISSGTFTMPKPLYREGYKADFSKLGTVTLSVR